MLYCVYMCARTTITYVRRNTYVFILLHICSDSVLLLHMSDGIHMSSYYYIYVPTVSTYTITSVRLLPLLLIFLLRYSLSVPVPVPVPVCLCVGDTCTTDSCMHHGTRISNKTNAAAAAGRGKFQRMRSSGNHFCGLFFSLFGVVAGVCVCVCVCVCVEICIILILLYKGGK